MRYLGIDFGLRKIGLAISEGEIAAPFIVLHVKSKEDAVKKIREIIGKERIDEVVIGIPESGKVTKTAALVSVITLGIPVHKVDETLTTYHAKRQMIAQGLGRKKRTEEDAYSAALILQDYLDNL